MCPQKAGSALGHERWTVDPGRRAALKMVFSEVVNQAVLAISILVVN
jgi:hypothetical protein